MLVNTPSLGALPVLDIIFKAVGIGQKSIAQGTSSIAAQTWAVEQYQRDVLAAQQAAVEEAAAAERRRRRRPYLIAGGAGGLLLLWAALR